MKEQELTNQLTSKLQTLLPPTFTVGSVRAETNVRKSNDIDILAIIKTPSESLKFAIEVKNTDRIANIRQAAYQIKKYTKSTNTIPMVAGPYIGERARQTLKDEDVGYIDLAGNLYFKYLNYYVEKIVDKNPFSNTPPLKNIFAPISSRITRVLLVEPNRKWTISELSKEAEVSLGQTYNVLEAMSEEELASKDNSGKWAVTSPTALLDAWKKVYLTYEGRKYSMFSYAKDRALPKLIVKASKEANLPYALGFFSGADLVAPYVRSLTKVQLYTSQEAVETWKDSLELKEVENGGNIELYVPYDKGVFYKTQEYKRDDGTVKIVNNVQLYMDLFNNPARGEEAAEHLRKTKLGY
jgi:hypothetical protein